MPQIPQEKDSLPDIFKPTYFGDVVVQDIGSSDVGAGMITPNHLSFDPFLPQMTVVAGEAITEGDLVCIRTYELSKISASQDARVLESSSATNYASDTSAVIGSTDATNTGGAWLFIKFDVSAVEIDDPDIVILRLDVTANSGAGITDDYLVKAYRVSADWDESTITWSNKPAIGTGIDDWRYSRSGDIEFDINEVLTEDTGENFIFLDITNYFRQWKAGSVSNYGIAIRFIASATGAEAAAAIRTVTVGTSEAGNAYLRPTLIASGISDNVRKAYRAESGATMSGDYTNAAGIIGFAKNSVGAGGSVTCQISGIVDGIPQPNLPPIGTTGYVGFFSGTVSNVQDTFIREVGTVLQLDSVSSGTGSIALSAEGSRIYSMQVRFSQGDVTNGGQWNQTIYVPVGFTPKSITFVGEATVGGSTVGAVGTWSNFNNGSVTNNVPEVFSDYLAYYEQDADHMTSLLVADVGASFVELNFECYASVAPFSAATIRGILTFYG